ncbi:MAG: hypothetical protein EOP04_30145 [Proteobacteria bacterium]|nr:MAG: hypothetical protein EOP04_30145 [Pseudomonadota bacterium]
MSYRILSEATVDACRDCVHEAAELHGFFYLKFCCRLELIKKFYPILNKYASSSTVFWMWWIGATQSPYPQSCLYSRRLMLSIHGGPSEFTIGLISL